MPTRDTVVIVTGATSGLGNAIATFLAKKGYKVYGTGRNPSAYERKADEYFELVQMNQAEDQSVAKAFAAVLAKEGRVDILVCNAGMGTAGSAEETPMEDIRLQMETDFLGTVRCVRAVLPVMRSAGRGKILVMSSVAGLVGMAFQSYYSAGKHALEGFVASLRLETSQFGIQVAAIEPCKYRTPFGEARQVAPGAVDGAYKARYEASMAVQLRNEAAGRDPLEIARLVYRLVERQSLAPRYVVGSVVQRAAIAARRLLPARLFELLYRMYYKIP